MRSQIPRLDYHSLSIRVSTTEVLVALKVTVGFTQDPAGMNRCDTETQERNRLYRSCGWLYEPKLRNRRKRTSSAEQNIPCSTAKKTLPVQSVQTLQAAASDVTNTLEICQMVMWGRRCDFCFPACKHLLPFSCLTLFLPVWQRPILCPMTLKYRYNYKIAVGCMCAWLWLCVCVSISTVARGLLKLRQTIYQVWIERQIAISPVLNATGTHTHTHSRRITSR